MISIKPLWENQQWVAVSEPDDADISELVEKYDVPRKYTSYILDPKERARFDYNTNHDCGLFVFRIVNRNANLKDTRHMQQTRPIYLLLKQDQLITVIQNDSNFVSDTMTEILSDERVIKQQPSMLTLALDLMFELNGDYFDRINELDDVRQELEGYKKRPNNTQIGQLSQLSKSLIYLKAAASGNLIAVRQLQVMSDADDDPINLNKAEDQRLQDLRTEIEQSTEMAQVNGEIVQQVADAYSKILDNSLNDTMRLLTIWSLAFAVPPIISGFYGMNVKLPLMGGWFDWPFSVMLSLIPVILMVWYLRRNHDL